MPVENTAICPGDFESFFLSLATFTVGGTGGKQVSEVTSRNAMKYQAEEKGI